jgi:hypothetical protein
MPRKQTRRAVSLKGETYAQAHNYCVAHGLSMSGFLEQLIAEFFKPAPADTYPGSDIPKEVPTPAKNGKIRGGGIHEF